VALVPRRAPPGHAAIANGFAPRRSAHQPVSHGEIAELDAHNNGWSGMMPSNDHEKTVALSALAVLVVVLTIEVFTVIRMTNMPHQPRNQQLSIWDEVFRGRR
jgi:hypothetical protein